jgi:hypothetical protein
MAPLPIVSADVTANKGSRELVSILVSWITMKLDIATETLTDDSRGIHKSDTIFSDLDTAQLASLPCTQPHRKVDRTLVDADQQGNLAPIPVEPYSLLCRLCQDVHRYPYDGLRQGRRATGRRRTSESPVAIYTPARRGCPDQRSRWTVRERCKHLVPCSHRRPYVLHPRRPTNN